MAILHAVKKNGIKTNKSTIKTAASRGALPVTVILISGFCLVFDITAVFADHTAFCRKIADKDLIAVCIKQCDPDGSYFPCVKRVSIKPDDSIRSVSHSASALFDTMESAGFMIILIRDCFRILYFFHNHAVNFYENILEIIRIVTVIRE